MEFGSSRLDEAPSASSRWRFVPLTVGLLIALIAGLTMGAGVLLTPIGAVLTVIALRRTVEFRGVVFWAGTALNAVLVVLFLATVAIVADELLSGS